VRINPREPQVPHGQIGIPLNALEALEAGRSVALVSDAGTPLIADPGFRLVQEAVQAGIPVTALPGASAALVALACAIPALAQPIRNCHA